MLLVVPFPPSIPLRPAHPLPPTFPPFSSCPWVIQISSLASTFPILFLTSPCLFSTYHLCYLFSVPSPLSPLPTPLPESLLPRLVGRWAELWSLLGLAYSHLLVTQKQVLCPGLWACRKPGNWTNTLLIGGPGRLCLEVASPVCLRVPCAATLEHVCGRTFVISESELCLWDFPAFFGWPFTLPYFLLGGSWTAFGHQQPWDPFLGQFLISCVSLGG